MGELNSKPPTETLDVLGRVCPYPLLLTKKAIEKLPVGSILKVLCDAPASAEAMSEGQFDTEPAA